MISENDSIETLVCGLCMKHPENLPKMIDLGLEPVHFSEKWIRQLYEAMLLQEKQGLPYTRQEIRIRYGEKFGPKIWELEFGIDPQADKTISDHAHEIINRYWARKIAEKYGMALALIESRKPYDDIEPIKQHLIEDLHGLENGPAANIGTSQSIRDVVSEDITVLDKQINNWDKQIKNGITTGFPKIDEETNGGFHEGCLYIIAARTGQGKSQLGIWFTIQAAFEGKKTAYFTVEMPNQQLARKMYSNISGVDSKKVMSGRLETTEIDAIGAAMKMVSGKNIQLNDKFKRSFSALESELRRLKRHGLLDICVIDYLQQLRIKEQKFFSLNEQLTEISGRLKEIAIELEIPIIVIAQLNRDAATAPEGPQPYHIKDCGCIEQDADMIFILHDEPIRENKDKPHEVTGYQTKLQMAKNRWGEEFSMKIDADLSTSRFKET